VSSPVSVWLHSRPSRVSGRQNLATKYLEGAAHSWRNRPVVHPSLFAMIGVVETSGAAVASPTSSSAVSKVPRAVGVTSASAPSAIRRGAARDPFDGRSPHQLSANCSSNGTQLRGFDFVLGVGTCSIGRGERTNDV
jgi:hypothetical protein